MEKKKFKLGLLPKLLIAIVLGIIIGQFFPVWFCRVVVTASSIFSSFLKFIIPLMIVAYVTMGIADLKSGAGKLLLITVALAYGSTLIAGSASYLVSANLFPSFMSEGALEQIAATADNSLASYISISIPPILDTLSAVVLAFVLRSFLCFVVGYWGHTFGIRVEADIRRDLFRHMQELDFGYYDRNRTGALMSRLTSELFEITELAHHGPEDIFISGVTVIGALVIMFTIQWRLALVIAAILPVFLIVVWTCRRSMSQASRHVKQKTAAINAGIESGISGIRTAKAFANEAEELEKFNVSNDVYKTSKKEFHKAMGRFNGVMEFFLSILSVAVIAAGGVLIMRGELNTVDLITFSLYITTFVNPVRKLANFSELLANGTAGFSRFLELMRTEPAMKDAPDAVELTDVKGQVDVDHVSFAYEGDLDVLHDVDLHIKAGETLAVVGPSGGGKSTLCKLIPRFYDVTAGRILIDGVDIREISQHKLRSLLGFVPQKGNLFSGDIASNIKYGGSHISDEKMIEAAEIAQATEFIDSKPEGYESPIAQGGSNVSGGQKQRLSIARAVYRHPEILIFDDSFSALDFKTDRAVRDALEKEAKDSTKLIVAQRIGTIMNADRIIVLDDGKVVGQGTHEELLDTCEVYRQIAESQLSEDELKR